jgi:pyrroline-5-carboxylate reductase
MMMLANRLLSAATATTRRANFSTSTSTSNIFDKITFIGTGKMGQAMLSPLITQNLQSPSSMTVYDVSESALRRVEELYPGVKASSSIPDAIADSNLIVYGVKPQNVSKVHAEIRRAKLDGAGGRVRDDAIILSVVAGTPIQNYVDGSLVLKVARSMPNTPAQIGCGVTVWSCTDNIDSDERRRITAVLDSFGKTIFVEDESFIDMSTSISGSGPAYVFMLIEAMVDAGVHMGFSRDTATTLVHHTLLGSTKFAMETGEHPGEMNITFFFLSSISSLGEEFSLIASLIVAATTNTRSGIEE